MTNKDPIQYPQRSLLKNPELLSILLPPAFSFCLIFSLSFAFALRHILFPQYLSIHLPSPSFCTCKFSVTMQQADKELKPWYTEATVSQYSFNTMEGREKSLF